MVKNIYFIVTEEHFMANYANLLDHLREFNIPIDIISVPSYNNVGMRDRLFNGKSILKKIKNKVVTILGNQISDSIIIYSNAEGYMLFNREYWMPSMVNCKEVLLQHGILPIVINKYEHIKSLVFNTLFWFLPKYMKYGGNFPQVRADMLIVWGQIQKKFCINNYNWLDNQILVSGKLLKPLYEHCDIHKNTALFLLQDYSNQYGITKAESICNIQNVIDIIAPQVDKLYIRRHPKMPENYYDQLCLNEKCVISKGLSLNEDMGRASIIVSFCSAGLLDAYVGGKKIIAIRIPKIPDADYAIFGNAIQLNKLKDLSLQSYSTEINSDYFNVDNNQLEICRNILNLK